jgi:hypothetical protein
VAGSDAAQQIDPCSSRNNFHPMQSASAQVAQMGKFVSAAAGTHRMELGVNDGCSSDGRSGQLIDPAKVRKRW